MENCTYYDVTIERKDLIGFSEIEEEELIPLTDDIISSVCTDIHNKLPRIKKKWLSREDITQRCNLQVPPEFKDTYIDILFKHQDAIRIDKYGFGLAKDYHHGIHLKTNYPVYQKQFKIPEAHHQFIKQTQKNGWY